MRIGICEPGIMETTDGHAVGIALGMDFTSEHESGLQGLSSLLRVVLPTLALVPRVFRRDAIVDAEGREVLVGIDARRVMADRETLSRHVVLHETDRETRLVVRHMRDDADRQFWRSDGVRTLNSRSPDLTTAWDSNGFLIRAFSEKARTVTRDLHEALMNRDMALGLGGMTADLTGGGLRLPIVSRLDSSLLEEMRARDLDRIALAKAARRTGVEAIVNSPRREQTGLRARLARHTVTS